MGGGIGGVLGLLSLGGFALFLIGVGVVVLSSSQGRPVRSGISLAVIGLVAGLIFTVVGQGILIVQPTEVAVIFNTVNGDLEDPPRRAGTHIIIPAVQAATLYRIDQQAYPGADGASDSDTVQARTADGQSITLDVTIIYSLNPDDINTVHSRWRDRYENDFIRPTTRGVVRDSVSNFRAVEIYGVERAEMEQLMQDIIAERMTAEGLILSDLLVRDITFSEEFAASIERAQIAEQEAEQARFRVEQRRQEADQARAVAQGERDAEIARAEGQAQSIILRAQAEAEALRLVSEQLAANPLLIQYQYIQNLADNINLALVPSNTPFLFDFDSIVADPDFEAPDVPDSILDLTTEGTLGPAATPEPGS